MPLRTQVLIDDRERPRLRTLRVEVRHGPDRGSRQDLDVDPIRVGTADGCEVRLRDPAVSGMHLELARTPLGLLVRDLGSTNGTFVDGRRVQGMYADGAVTVRLGASEIRVTPLGREAPIELASADRFGELLGASTTMRALFAKLARVAPTDCTVLVTGETGSGKELAAAALHEHSLHAAGPLVVVDCGALPATLIESELFGHERGAFTGAERARAGAFECANGGTLFLDEIGEMPLALQPALLGVLERREVRRVGGSSSIRVDVRVIAATHRDLAAEVARGAFRADLYYRLAVVEVRMPPLREHVDDIPLLIDAFLAELPGDRPVLSPDTIAQMRAYPWPGNVRELRNVIERAVLLAEPPRLTEPAPRRSSTSGTVPAAMPTAPAVAVDVHRPFKDQKNALVSSFERAYVRALLVATGGNIAAAARRAGIDRMYLYKLIERYRDDAS